MSSFHEHADARRGLATRRARDIVPARSRAALIETWLREGSDEQVFRACPNLWARERGLDPHEAVKVLLHAVQAGLVRIGWELSCPGCGMIIDSLERLGDVGNHFHCKTCDADRDLALDDWIQVTFSVRREVRPVRFHDVEALKPRDRILNCIISRGIAMRSGELLVEHVRRGLIMAASIPPGQRATATFTAERGLLLAVPGGLSAPISEGEGGAARLSLRVSKRGNLEGFPKQVRTGPVEIEIHNESDGVCGAWLMQTDDFLRFGPPIGYSAAQLIHHPTYAELFPKQLACSGGLTIRKVALLFSDLVGSTAMYKELGDLRAYERVREHFALLSPIITQCGGLWVKDIGDAIMASFPEADTALQAGLSMIETVRGMEGLDLKVGLHVGSCIGVDYRGHLDWFGTTVNLAARIQSLAGPGEICISQRVHDDVSEKLGELSVEPFRTQVRGIEEPIAVYRVRVP
jgi:class 3 adenylate cyclase